MCDTCGCDSKEDVRVMLPGDVSGLEKDHPHSHHEHDHHHSHNHNHHHHNHEQEHHNHNHDHSERQSNTIEVELQRDVLHKNDLLAERNRGFFEGRNIIALNLVSSPGSGKTTLLEATIKSLKDQTPIYIIEGDQQTMNDANRILAAGAPVVQVNTGKGCHLDSEMIQRSLTKLNPELGSMLFIENVGNLVCPSMFDLGETVRVVIMSVTEGEDKPLKYPNMFETSQVCIINKIDLLPYLDYDMKKAIEFAVQVNPELQFFEVSAKNGEGMDDWINWLKTHRPETKPAM